MHQPDQTIGAQAVVSNLFDTCVGIDPDCAAIRQVLCFGIADGFVHVVADCKATPRNPFLTRTNAGLMPQVDVESASGVRGTILTVTPKPGGYPVRTVI
jgi:hypothetical protein